MRSFVAVCVLALAVPGLALADKKKDSQPIKVVELKRMPLGNETAMENEERAAFATWIKATR